ncbi:MAG TPA: hypothetical protein VMX35_07065 [Acidobacteriota bacterium]|nr:hypothetical protein [Acidobacteriota bacterium]
MILLVTLLKGLAKALRYWQPIAFLVLVQLVLAWLVASPLTMEMHRAWDHSTIAHDPEILPAMQGIAMDELMLAGQERFESLYNPLFMAIAGVIYVLFSMLVLAGVLPLYAGLDLKFNWERFWGNASRYFRPFIGLAVLAALLFWAADLASELVDAFVKDALAGSDDEFSVFVTGTLAVGAFRFLLFSLIVLVFQYAKVIAAAEGLRNIIYLTRKAFGFVSRFFVVAVILFSLLGLIEFGIVALDAAVWNYALPGADSLFGWGWLVLVMLLLSAVKLSFFSSQVLLYTEISRRASEGVRVELNSGSYETLV